jgi:hypothetical protein
LKKIDHILKELGTFYAGYQERKVEDIIIGASTSNNDAKGPLEDQKAN